MAEQKQADAPSFRITYFGFGGRAAPARAAATIGGLSFEDRFQSFAEHGAAKQNGTRRWAGVPELTIYDKDGKEVATVGQSNNVLRYVGKLTGLYPENAVSAALVDEVLDSLEDLVGLAGPSFSEKDNDKKKAMREALMADDKFPYWVKKFELRFEENEKRGNKNGYIVGDTLTIADLKLYYALGFASTLDFIDTKKLLGDAKRINAFNEKIKSDERMVKFEEAFAARTKEYKEKQTSSFKCDGKGSYGAL